MPQTSISDRMSKGYAGQVTEQFPSGARSASAQVAVSGGMPVKRGTDAQSQVRPYEAGDVPSAANLAGVIAFTAARPYTASGEIDADSPVDVLRMGSVLMDFSEAVTAGEQVGLVLATGLLTGIPHGTAAGAIATGTVVLPCLRIVETITAAGLATVEVMVYGSQDAATVGTL